jgi:translation initiation factor IF-2-like protein
MSKIKVNQLARKLEIPTHRLLAFLATMGVTGVNRSSSIDSSLESAVQQLMRLELDRAQTIPVQSPIPSVPVVKLGRISIELRLSLVECPVCRCKLKSAQLKRHYRKVHKGSKNNQHQPKSKHEKTAARGSPLVACPICQYQIRDRDLQSHMANAHSKSRSNSRKTLQGGLVNPR